MIYNQIQKAKASLKVVSKPRAKKDYIASKAWEALDKLDSDVSSVLIKNFARVKVNKLNKSVRFELEGKPLEIKMGTTKVILPKTLIVYEDKDGIKEAWYCLLDAKRNRVFLRTIVKNHEVLFR